MSEHRLCRGGCLQDLPGQQDMRVFADLGLIGLVPARPVQGDIDIRGSRSQLLRGNVPQCVPGQDRDLMPGRRCALRGADGLGRQQAGVGDRRARPPVGPDCCRHRRGSGAIGVESSPDGTPWSSGAGCALPVGAHWAWSVAAWVGAGAGPAGGTAAWAVGAASSWADNAATASLRIKAGQNRPARSAARRLPQRARTATVKAASTA
jgi:hypothetical protein